MKVLYVTSGHIYYPHRYLDTFIVNSFHSISAQHLIRVFEVNHSVNWPPQLISVVNQFKPDFIFSIHGSQMSPALVEQLRRLGAKVGMWFVDDPYDVDASKQRLFGYDFVITNERKCVDLYKRLGVAKVFYVRFGTQTSVYYPEEQPEAYQSDLCVVGSPFPKRVELIKFLVASIPQISIKLVGPNWQQHMAGRVEIINRPVEPNEVRKFYNGAKINLNMHRGNSEHLTAGVNLNQEGIEATSPNSRTFDIAACKAFQLVDARPGLNDYFDLQQELAVYHNPNELVNQIVHYLQTPDERKRIAENAYRKTLRVYRLESSLLQLFQLVEGEICVERNRLVSPEILKRSQLVKGDKKPAVYLIVDGWKHEFPSREVFNRLHLRWEDIQLFPQNLIERIPTGVTLVM